jgi:large conductance mechanosensitive channel
MKDMWNDFKEFAFKGNVFDLAIAVVIGAAFGKIVSSLVENIIMPLIGAISGGIDFSGLHKTIGKADVTYGVFLQSVFDFLIVAFVIFMVIRLLAKFKRKEEPVIEEAVPEIDPKEALLVEIRDLLKEGKTL